MKKSIAQIIAERSLPGCSIDCGSNMDARFAKDKLQFDGEAKWADLKVVGTRLCSATLSAQELGKAIAACLE